MASSGSERVPRHVHLRTHQVSLSLVSITYSVFEDAHVYVFEAEYVKSPPNCVAYLADVDFEVRSLKNPCSNWQRRF